MSNQNKKKIYKMDFNVITTALTFFFGGTSIVSTIVGVVFFKENKELKKNEVKSSTADVQSKNIQNDNDQIDLGTKFMEQSLAMTQKMQEMMHESNKVREEQWEEQKISNDEIITRIGGVERKLDDINDRVTSIEEWGNGELSAFRASHNKRYQEASTVK